MRVLLVTVITLAALAAPAHAVETTITLGTGEHRIQVPAGVNSIDYELYGGRGGGGTMPSAGAGVSGALSGIDPGDVFWGYVGSSGATALNGSGGGGGGTDIRYTRKASPCDGESAADIIWAAGGGGGRGADALGGGFGGDAGQGGGESVETGAFGGESGDEGGQGGGGGGNRVANCGGIGGPDGAGAAGGFNGGGNGGSGSTPGGGGGGGYDGGGGGGNGSGGGGGSSNGGDFITYTGPPRMVLSWNDTDTPAVTIATPGAGETLPTTTPLFSGTGGRVLGDGSVQLRFEQGSTIVDRVVAVDPETGEWRLEGLALARGAWTLTALQADSAGHQGTATRQFTIAQDATGPDPDPGPGDTPPLEATFTPSTPTVRPGGSLILDGAGSRPAGVPVVSFAWDLTGDGKPEIDCNGATPILDTSMRRSATVGLTVTDALGRTSTARQAINVTGTSTLPAARGARPRRTVPGGIFSGSPYHTGMCKSDAVTAALDTTSAGPPAGCNAEVTFGEIKAVGCFERVDRGDLPPAEYRILRPYLDESIEDAGRELDRAGDARVAQVLGRYTPGQARELALLDALYMTTQTARINGIDVVPQKGSAIVVVAGGWLNNLKSAVVSSDARVQMLNEAGRELRMTDGLLREVIEPLAGKPLFEGLTIERELDLVPALGIRGRVTTRIDRYATKIVVHAVLPDLLGGVTAEARMRADTSRGLILDGLDAHADTVPIGPVIFRDLDLSYRGSDQALDGGLSVSLPPTGTTVRAEIGFLRGAFNRLRIRYDGPPDIILAPAVHLTGLGAAFQVDPTQFTGDATLNFGPNPGGGCPKLGAVGAMVLNLEYPLYLEVTGSSQILCYKLAQMRAYLDETGYGSFTGKVDPDLGPLPLRFRAEGTGQVQLPINGRQLRFQLNANGEGCLVIADLIDECIGGEVVVSDEAMGFCGDFGFTHAGAGFRYPPPEAYANTALLVAYTVANLVVMESSCNIDQFRTIRGAQAAQAQTFPVPASQDVLVLAVVGANAPPRFVLRGPGGRTIDVPDTGMLRTATEAAFRYAQNTTYVLVDDPAAGSWAIDLKPGSSPVAEIKVADANPDPVVRGRVRRAGGRLAFSYDAKLSRGDELRFFERVAGRGGQLLGAGRAGRHTLRFLPAEGSSTRRTIIAEVTRDGLPVKTLTAARFRSGPPAIGRPRRVRARRRGKRLQISWRRAVNATAHRATVSLSDGRRLLLVPKGRRTRVVVPNVRKGTRVRIAVRGERPGPRFGKSARRSARIR